MTGQPRAPIPAPDTVAAAKQALLQMKLEALNSCTVELEAAIGRLGQLSALGRLSREEARGLARDIRQTTALAHGAEDWIITELALAGDPPVPGYEQTESTSSPSARILVRG